MDLGKSIPIEDVKIINRTNDYFKELKVLASDKLVYFCASQKQETNENFQVIFNRGASEIATLYSSNNRNDNEAAYERLRIIFNGLSEFISCKPRYRSPKFIKSLVWTSLTEKDWSWLHIAANVSLNAVFKSNKPEVLSLLNNNDNKGKLTPLMVALKVDKSDSIKPILSLEPDIMITNAEGNNILHMSASGPLTTLLLVIKYCYRKSELAPFRARNNNDLTPLHIACYANKVSNVNEFLKIGLTPDLLSIEPSDKTIKSGKFLSFESTSSKPIIFTQDMINGLDVDEIKYGGSPLHWCKSKKLMYKLLQYNFHLDCVNTLRESAAHVLCKYPLRIDVLIPLLNVGAPVNTFDQDKRTPLHIAVQNKNIKAVEALIVHDCNLNKIDSKKQSPRHLAANINDSDGNLILFILHQAGATRCMPKMDNCKDGCSPDGKSVGTCNIKWPLLTNITTHEEFLFTDLLKKDIKKSQVKRVNMICFDGGGTRGLNSIQILIELQKKLTKPLVTYFQWIGGTSTGSIIAASLVLNKTLAQLRHDYFSMKDDIINTRKPHNSEVLDDVLKRTLGENVKMSSLGHKKLLITSVLADRDPAKLHLFRSIPRIPSEDSPLSNYANIMPGIAIPGSPTIGPGETPLGQISTFEDQLLWEACRASCAAPSLFKPFGPFVDGGLIANNPTMDILTDFVRRNKFLELDKSSELEQLNLVLSIGTGKPPSTQVKMLDVLNVGNYPVRAIRSAIKFLSIKEFLTQLITQPDDHIVERAQSWCAAMNVPYYRVNPILTERVSLDETNDGKIIENMYFTKLYMAAIEPKLDELKFILETWLETQSS